MALMLASLKTLWSLQNLIFDILLKPRPLQAFSKAIRKSQVLGERAETGRGRGGEHKEKPGSHKGKLGSHKESNPQHKKKYHAHIYSIRKNTMPIYGQWWRRLQQVSIRKNQVLGRRAETEEGGGEWGEHKEKPGSHKDKPGSHKGSNPQHKKKYRAHIWGNLEHKRRTHEHKKPAVSATGWRHGGRWRHGGGHHKN